ncbi:hypothetical protein HBH77_125900 [Parastagonospora nodorum]|nr:hypothetical protein HBH77_125900 [Parastagonospora nodorum]KAH5386258.1 hypothetical protein HBI33_077330 [Parastagonospora nodorum]
MRLLWRDDDGTLRLAEFLGKEVPPYAILSHTWGNDDEEVTYKDIVKGRARGKKSYIKIQFCMDQATRDKIKYSWIDTCCIDKTSSAELTEAINSMFRWYRNAALCYVYLSDVSISTNDESFRGDLLSPTLWTLTCQHSKWFTRGWTLQELIAAASLRFYSTEGKQLGEKHALAQELNKITGISVDVLQGGPMSHLTFDERMSWAAERKTKREEDLAYALLGIFDIHMPLIYGEGQEKAFSRLRRAIRESIDDDPPVSIPVVPSKQRKRIVDVKILRPKISSSHRTRSIAASRIEHIYAELLRGVHDALPQIMFILMLVLQVPRALSQMLPDNIVLRDFLGRKHSLQTEYFQNWPVLIEMLASRFKDCPGHVHISRGSFTIMDVDNFGRRIGASNWQAVVSKRKRFIMLVNISETKLVNNACTRCGERIRKQGAFTGICRSCNLFYRSLTGPSSRLTSQHLQTLKSAHYVSGNLPVPKDPEKLMHNGKCVSLVQEHARLTGEFLDLAIDAGIIKGLPKTTMPVEFSRDMPHAPESSQIRDEADQVEGDIEMKAGANDIDEVSEDEESPDDHSGLIDRSSLDREQEQRELQHFSSICVEQDSSLHDAAYSSNITEMLRLLCTGHQVDENWGLWGTPMIAAVLSGSTEAIQTLLNAGADPLLSAGPLGYPLNAAAYVDHASCFQVILDATIQRRSASRKRAQSFQDAVDQSLFTFMDGEHHGPEILLLYAGANPFKQFSGGRSAFAVALGKKNDLLTTCFLAEAWGRQLLSPHEVLCLWATVAGNDVDAKLVRDPWLASCCRNIMINRSQMLENRISARLSSHTKPFFQVHQDWRALKSRGRSVGAEYLDGFAKVSRSAHAQSYFVPPVFRIVVN